MYSVQHPIFFKCRSTGLKVTQLQLSYLLDDPEALRKQKWRIKPPPQPAKDRYKATMKLPL